MTRQPPGRTSRLRETVRTQLWPVPTLGVLVALILGVLVPRLDRAIDGQLPASVAEYLFGGGAGAARTVLDAIASSLITVTSLTFSADRGDPAAGQQSVLPPTAAHLHQ